MPVLPDVLAPGLKIMFCGSAAGNISARRGAYYAGPGNRFWPMLHKTGLTPQLLAPEAFRTLPDYGLGLTDLCKDAAGADHELPPGADDVAALTGKILSHAPEILAFVGKRAARVRVWEVDLGLQADLIGTTRVFVLPSPSGAARRYWDEAPWFELARLVPPFTDK